MDDDDVWGGEMPNFPRWRRHGDPADETQLDELLAGQADAAPAPEWRSVADVLSSAAAAAAPSELAGEPAALAAFRRERMGVRNHRPQPIARCKTVLSTLVTGRIAACLAAGAVTLTGAATAAYACVLPTPIQSFAHHTIAAPAPGSHSSAVNAEHHQWTPSPSPTASVSATATAATAATASASPSPKPTPSAVAALKEFVAYRMCQDYTATTKAGKTLDPKELAALVKLAGSSTAITSYCAALPVPPMPACPMATASPTATPSPTATALPHAKFGWWGWCGTCPAPTSTATPMVSPSPSATPGKDKFPFFGCGWFDPGRFWGHRPPGAKGSKPTTKPGTKPTAKSTVKPTATWRPTPKPPTTFPSPFPGGWFDSGRGFGFAGFGGSEHDSIKAGQSGVSAQQHAGGSK
jgi:hypothetical protein